MRAGPELSYDAIVQFGYSPITNIVNLQWRHQALERHNAQRKNCPTENYKKVVADYMEHRQSKLKVHSKKSQKSKGVVSWKRPVCMQKKRTVSGKSSKV